MSPPQQREIDATMRMMQEMTQSIAAARKETAHDIAEFQSYIQEFKHGLESSERVVLPVSSHMSSRSKEPRSKRVKQLIPSRPSLGQLEYTWVPRNGRMTLQLGPLPPHETKTTVVSSSIINKSRSRSRGSSSVKNGGIRGGSIRGGTKSSVTKSSVGGSRGNRGSSLNKKRRKRPQSASGGRRRTRAEFTIR